MRSLTARFLVVGAMVIITMVFGTPAVSADQTSVEITHIEAGCNSAEGVSGKVRLFNAGSQDKLVSVTLTLTQHIPPSQGGSPHFILVPRQEQTFEVMVFSGEEGAFTFMFPTLGVDPRANSLRIESSGLNPKRSESFGPCDSPPTLPPPVSATPVSESPTPTPFSELGTPLSIGPTTPTPTVLVARLPSTGHGGGDHSNPPPIEFSLAAITFVGLMLLTGGVVIARK